MNAWLYGKWRIQAQLKGQRRRSPYNDDDEDDDDEDEDDDNDDEDIDGKGGKEKSKDNSKNMWERVKILLQPTSKWGPAQNPSRTLMAPLGNVLH